MRIAYVHLPRFPVQRKVREAPSLAHRPFALAEESKGHRRVVFASSAAIRAGVKAGMGLTAACALEPALQHFSFQPAAEQQALLSLGETLLCLSPAFELSAPDGLWLDASAAHLRGGEVGLLEALLDLFDQQGLKACAALASDRFTARALARHGGKRLQAVARQDGARALAALPLGALEGAEAEAVGPLSALGLTRLGEVAALPAGALLARLGALGLRVHRLCRGEDDARLVPTPLPERVEEAIALDWPAESVEPLWFALKTLFDRVGGRLAGRKLAAVRLELALTLDPSGRRAIPLALARPAAQPKLLLDLAKHRIADLTLENPVSGVAVRVEEASADPGQQLVLGEGPQGDAALEVVLSRLATALGDEALLSAALKDAHRPEAAFEPAGFHPPVARQGMWAEALEAARTQAPPLAPSRPARLFSSPAALDAEVGHSGELRGARLLGKRRKVIAVDGPERLCGGWWEGTPFDRDYFRVHFEGVGPVWVFRDLKDGRFYLQGLFD